MCAWGLQGSRGPPVQRIFEPAWQPFSTLGLACKGEGRHFSMEESPGSIKKMSPALPQAVAWLCPPKCRCLGGPEALNQTLTEYVDNSPKKAAFFSCSGAFYPMDLEIFSTASLASNICSSMKKVPISGLCRPILTCCDFSWKRKFSCAGNKETFMP